MYYVCIVYLYRESWIKAIWVDVFVLLRLLVFQVLFNCWWPLRGLEWEWIVVWGFLGLKILLFGGLFNLVSTVIVARPCCSSRVSSCCCLWMNRGLYQNYHRNFYISTWCLRPGLVRILRASHPAQAGGHWHVAPLGFLRPQTLIILVILVIILVIQGEGAAPGGENVRRLLIFIIRPRISRPWLVEWIFNDRKQTSLSTITLIANLKRNMNKIRYKTTCTRPLTLGLW